MKTAVEFIESEVKMSDGVLTKGHLLLIIEQAKEMEKEQIELAHIDGGKNKRTAVEYYNDTFKSE